jgi:hypothetical protein
MPLSKVLSNSLSLTTLAASGAATLSNTLAVTGAATLSNTLAVTGAATLSNTLAVTGAATITGATILSSTLAVTGPATLSNTLAVTGAVTLSNTLAVTGAATLSNTLAVTGVTTVQAGTVSLPAITTTGDTNTGIYFPAADTIGFTEGGVEAMRIDSGGNIQIPAGAVMKYAPTPTAISGATTLTNAQIQGQIINTTGTSFTLTMAANTTLETLATWSTTNIGYDFYVINTASGTITMAINTGVTSLGTLTVATGVSAQFRIRRTAASTFVLYRLG